MPSIDSRGGVVAKTLASLLFVAAVALPEDAAPSQSRTPTTPLATRPVLTLGGAQLVLEAALAAGRSLATHGSIAVVDAQGDLLAFARIDGTFTSSPRIAIGKARTAARFEKPTAAFEQLIKDGRTPMLALDDFTPLQGGVPIVVDGVVVGAIGVSGAASARQDEDLAKAGAGALNGRS
jgi:glc operon protein GlcG